MQRLWHRGLFSLLLLLAPAAALAQSLSVPGSPLQPPSPNGLNRLLPLDVTYHTSSLLTPGHLTPNTNPSEVSIRSQQALLGTRLAGDGELSYVGPDESHVDQARDSRYQAVRLRLRGTEGPLQYGLGYRAAGAATTQDPDQATHSVWMNWATNQVTLRATMEERTTNLDRSPTRPTETQLQKRLGIDLHAAANGPVVRLSYLQQQTIDRLVSNAGGAGTLQDLDTVEGRIEYQLWGVLLQANSQYTAAHMPQMPQALHQQHRLEGRLSPLSGLTLESGLSVTADQDRLTNQRRDTSAAQVGLAYQLGEHSNLQLHTIYSRTQIPFGFEQSALSATTQWNWQIQRLGLAETALSLQTSYRSQTNAPQVSHVADDFAATIQLNVAGASWGDALWNPRWLGALR